MEIQQQKDVAVKVLSKLKTLDLFAMLAGGACRDWYLGKEASDLDFYVHYSNKYPQWALKETFKNLIGVDFEIIGKHGDQLGVDTEVEYTLDPNISYVLGGVVDGMTVQIVLINRPHMNVSDFCFDICQAFSKDGEKIEYTSAFKRAVDHKCIQITGEFYSKKGDYIKKIKSKFPDYLHIGF